MLPGFLINLAHGFLVAAARGKGEGEREGPVCAAEGKDIWGRVKQGAGAAQHHCITPQLPPGIGICPRDNT